MLVINRTFRSGGEIWNIFCVPVCMCSTLSTWEDGVKPKSFKPGFVYLQGASYTSIPTCSPFQLPTFTPPPPPAPPPPASATPRGRRTPTPVERRRSVRALMGISSCTGKERRCRRKEGSKECRLTTGGSGMEWCFTMGSSGSPSPVKKGKWTQ